MSSCAVANESRFAARATRSAATVATPQPSRFCRVVANERVAARPAAASVRTDESYVSWLSA
jgi:hypothetical protein